MNLSEITSLAMQTDEKRLAYIGQNLANVQTPGYKRLIAVQRPFSYEMETAATQMEAVVDTRPGGMRATGEAHDIALEGDGFLMVATPDGPALTRRATIGVNRDGMLVNEAGLPLLSDRGEIRVGIGNVNLSVSPEGEVLVDGRSAGRLQVHRASASSSIRPIGGGLYRVANGQGTSPVDAPRVRSGFQEASNVNSSNEMTSMLETSRHFEALARLVQGYDDVVEKAIHKLGDL